MICYAKWITGFKFFISNTVKNFLSFGPLSSLIVSLIGITVAEATGLIETVSKKYLRKRRDYLDRTQKLSIIKKKKNDK